MAGTNDPEEERARELFAEFLRRREQDPSLTTESFSRQHPAWNDAMRRMWEELQRFESLSEELHRQPPDCDTETES